MVEEEGVGKWGEMEAKGTGEKACVSYQHLGSVTKEFLNQARASFLIPPS